MVSHRNQQSTEGQPGRLTEDEVERVVDEFNAIWLAPPPTEEPLPKTLLWLKK